MNIEDNSPFQIIGSPIVGWHPKLLDEAFLRERINEVPDAFMVEMRRVPHFPLLIGPESDDYSLLGAILALWNRIPAYARNDDEKKDAVFAWKVNLLNKLDSSKYKPYSANNLNNTTKKILTPDGLPSAKPFSPVDLDHIIRRLNYLFTNFSILKEIWNKLPPYEGISNLFRGHEYHEYGLDIQEIYLLPANEPLIRKLQESYLNIPRLFFKEIKDRPLDFFINWNENPLEGK